MSNCTRCGGLLTESMTRTAEGWIRALQCMLCGRSPGDIRRFLGTTDGEAREIREKAKRLASGDYTRTYPSEPEKSTQREETVSASPYQAMAESERKALKARREALGLSRAEFAKKVPITTSFIEQMEINGYGSKDKQELVKLTLEKLELEKQKMASERVSGPNTRETRRKNLQSIVDTFGMAADLCAAFPSINVPSVRNILADRSGLGEGNARKWEIALNVEEGWFDEPNAIVPEHLIAKSKIAHRELPDLDASEAKIEAYQQQFENAEKWIIEIPVIGEMEPALESLRKFGFKRLTIIRRMQ